MWYRNLYKWQVFFYYAIYGVLAMNLDFSFTIKASRMKLYILVHDSHPVETRILYILYLGPDFDFM